MHGMYARNDLDPPTEARVEAMIVRCAMCIYDREKPVRAVLEEHVGSGQRSRRKVLLVRNVKRDRDLQQKTVEYPLNADVRVPQPVVVLMDKKRYAIHKTVMCSPIT